MMRGADGFAEKLLKVRSVPGIGTCVFEVKQNARYGVLKFIDHEMRSADSHPCFIFGADARPQSNAIPSRNSVRRTT
jgi:hypothetical protein